MAKSKPNTKKGRSSAPESPGVYRLKAKDGKTNYEGSTNNLQRRIKEHHRDPNKHFSKFTYEQKESTRDARTKEKSDLKKDKPPENKKR